MEQQNRKLHVVYFHGFGSGPNSEKVLKLRNAGFDVSAPDIPVDPEQAEEHLIQFIKDHVSDAIERGAKIFVFVGTSLGGYWAARMGEQFDAKQVLVNPAMNPEIELQRYVGMYTDHASGTQKELMPAIVEKFKLFPASGSETHRKYFIASNDKEVTPYNPPAGCDVVLFNSADHRGSEFFHHVISHLRDIENVSFPVGKH
jgi:predicted esterase YcpF (UPF0227 family)